MQLDSTIASLMRFLCNNDLGAVCGEEALGSNKHESAFNGDLSLLLATPQGTDPKKCDPRPLGR